MSPHSWRGISKFSWRKLAFEKGKPIMDEKPVIAEVKAIIAANLPSLAAAVMVRMKIGLIDDPVFNECVELLRPLHGHGAHQLLESMIIASALAAAARPAHVAQDDFNDLDDQILAAASTLLVVWTGAAPDVARKIVIGNPDDHRAFVVAAAREIKKLNALGIDLTDDPTSQTQPIC